MAKSKELNTSSLLDEVKKEEIKETAIEDMPLNSLADYLRYNARAREINKKLKIRRHEIKQCPVEMHPTQRIVFGRVDQPTNPLPVFVSNEMIEFKQTLTPGQTYDLPLCIIDYLSKKGTPVWDWITKPDGSKETHKISTSPRFALRTIYTPGQ